MNNWLALDADHWQAHPLNSLRGGMTWVLCWIGFQCILATLIFALLIISPVDLFDPEIPTLFNWVQWIFLASGPPVVWALLYRRVAYAPALYLVYFIGALLFPFWAEHWSPFLTAPQTYSDGEGQVRAALFATFTIIDLITLAYLFRSDRANVLLRRRIRVL